MRNRWLLPLSLVIALLSGASGLSAAAPPPDEITIQGINNLFVEASNHAIPSVVTIESERVIVQKFRHPFYDFWGEDFFRDNDIFPDQEQEFSSKVLGSGVIIDSDRGYIVTNHHVIEDAEEIKVRLFDQRVVEAEIVGSDPPSDVAIIKVDVESLQQMPTGDSDALRIGEWVLAIGSPFSEDLGHTITAGIVSGKGRSNVLPRARGGAQRFEYFIQTDAAINPGNSGGALVNLKGELVGINTAIATNGYVRANVGVGFAIPINLVMRVVEDLVEYGRVTRAWLGVYIESLSEGKAKALGLESLSGAIVNSATEDSPAEEAGLKDGDVILKVDDIVIRDASHLTHEISSSRPGDRRKLTMLRDGREKVITVKLGERPEEESLAASDRDDKDESSL